MKTKKTLLALACLAGLIGAIRSAATPEEYVLQMRANSFTLFGSHLADFFGGPDHLNNMFPAPPSGSIVYKFTGPAGPYVASVYLGAGSWSPDLSMVPGEAAWFYNPASFDYVAPIMGLTACCPPPPLPVARGFYMLAGTTVTGPVTGAMWADLTSSPEVDGMSIYTFGPGGFSVYNYSVDLGGWDPVSPFPLRVGQGVFLLKP